MTEKEHNKIVEKNLKALLSDLKDMDQKEVKSRYRNFKSKNFKSHIQTQYLKYAAIILLTIAVQQLTHILLQSDNQKYGVTTVESPLAQFSKLKLPDGSTVFLNSGSTIQYEQFGKNNQRRIQLNGEAYFEVEKSETDIFIVETKKYEFKVYGTKFNIQSYKNNNIINTTLIEGSLGVCKKGHKDFIRLKPNQLISINTKTGTTNLNNTSDTAPYLDWKSGIYRFENKRLEEIAQQLERWYNIEIEFKNKKAKNYSFSGLVIKKKPVTQILDAFKQLDNIKYKIVNKNTNIQKIIIE